MNCVDVIRGWTRAILTILVSVLLPMTAGAAILRPAHVVVVVMQDRFSDALGSTYVNGSNQPIFTYLNGLVPSSLVYSNSHGVTHPSEPNSLAMYSGSTLGITDNGRDHVFNPNTPNIAQSLNTGGFTFVGYSESLPSDGSQVTQAGTTGVAPDLYTRNLNPMAQFTTLNSSTNQPEPNPGVNKTFAAFTDIAQSGNSYANLPTVSYVIPNNFHNTHGSNENAPWAGSPDEANNNILRGWADDWLEANIDPYLQWAKTNNSLLIITQDEERWTGGTAATITTLVNGDPDLFVSGINGIYYNHYNLLRTLTDMYALAPLGESAGVSAFATNASGQLTVPEPSGLLRLAGAGLLLIRRRKLR